MDFGFTKDRARIIAAEAWRDAAIADGWMAEPTYQNESISRAATLSFEGFKAQIITRLWVPGGWHAEVSIAIWGPDGLAIIPPDVYDMRAIRAGLQRCQYCDKIPCLTVRVGFAGRACEECAEKKLRAA